MKCIPVFALILLFTAAHAQDKKTYFKASPTFFSPHDKNASFGGYLAGGLKLHQFISAGVTGGYFKFDKEAVIPAGIEVNISNFATNKIKPILTAQAFYPFYKKEYDSYTDNGNDYGDIKLKGKFMVAISGGISIPLKGNSLLITGGYSRLSLSGSGSAFTSYTSLPKGLESSNILFGSVSILF